jgi:predicted O-linked N-acetylglucosamine transferase (SPINDLY family)
MQRSITNNQGLLARALAAHQAGNVSEAEFLFKLVLQSDKKQFDALHMLGVIEGQRGNFAAGLRRLNEALRIRPNAADALINLGRVQSELGDNAGAIATYRKVLSLNPRSALAHNNFSVVLYRQRQLEEALAHCDAAIGIARDYADAWNNRGNVLFGLERWNDALESYDRALILQPRLAEAYLGRGNVLHQLKRYDDALAAYDSALAINPSHAECHFGRGNVLNVLQNREDEFAAYAKAFALKPDLQNAEGARLFAKMRICDWDNLEAECAHLVAMAAQGLPRSTPFTMIATSVSPADQMKCAERYMADRFPASPHPLWRGECYRHERIRVAYLASEFHNHVVAYVTAGMFEAHDRSRFEITAVSFGPDSDDEMRSRLRRAFDRFLDVRTRSDQEIAEVLRDLEIDIAVDLTGFTGFARTSILARRVAPVQVSYLGFAGTMAASYVDYIVADHTVIPPEHSAFYTEKVVRLPDTYQVYDAKLAIAPLTPPRDQLELPAEGFIFCSFNNAYKIRPETFDVWMRLLKQVEGSVLWLFLENAAVSRNLRREAERRGVAPERLVFAPHFPLPEHLARHRQADLALDTLPYNGHATTSHALWAGVPVVTCLGTTFAGRVAASVLRAAGLPELVTESLEDYEALASKIASEPAYCASLKDKLARNRQAFPLFDTERFTRHLEAAYTTMWQRSQSGAPPQSFAVEPLQCSDRA